MRWFLLLLMLVTPTFFLVLVMAIRNPPHGVTPLVLVGLFLVGWPMRLWVVRRLGGGPYAG